MVGVCGTPTFRYDIACRQPTRDKRIGLHFYNGPALIAYPVFLQLYCNISTGFLQEVFAGIEPFNIFEEIITKRGYISSVSKPLVLLDKTKFFI